MIAYFEWPLLGEFRDVGPTPLRRWDACSACGGGMHVQVRELELALQPELSVPPRVGTTMDGEVVVHDAVASDLADLGCAFESRPVHGVGEGRLWQLVPTLAVSAVDDAPASRSTACARCGGSVSLPTRRWRLVEPVAGGPHLAHVQGAPMLLVVSEAANRVLQRYEQRFSGRRVAGPSTPWPEPIDWGSMS